jgi:hypothetical protein
MMVLSGFFPVRACPRPTCLASVPNDMLRKEPAVVPIEPCGRIGSWQSGVTAWCACSLTG